MIKVPKRTGLQYPCNKYIKENIKDQVDFLPDEKCRRFLQSNAIILGVYVQACPYYPK